MCVCVPRLALVPPRTNPAAAGELFFFALSISAEPIQADLFLDFAEGLAFASLEPTAELSRNNFSHRFHLTD